MVRGTTGTQLLVDYFTDVAAVLGAKKSGQDGADRSGEASVKPAPVTAGEAGKTFPEQVNYSLLWYFQNHLRSDLDRGDDVADMLRVFFDISGEARDRHRESVGALRAERDRVLRNIAGAAGSAGGNPDSQELNQAQAMAVANALTLPFSVIQGPPGTGKTKTIAAIAKAAMAAGQTVAIVSSNGTAVSNVADKLTEMGLSEKFALLGNSRLRHLRDEGFAAAEGGWEKAKLQAGYTAVRPIILSTVPSLKKCFKDGVETKYDLLIMDECSQSDLLVGIVALSSARRVVLVGDDEQLPPIYNHDDLEAVKPPAELDGRKFGGSLWDLSAAEGGPENRWKNFRDPSFLWACSQAFGVTDGLDSVLLNMHYRCHPGIIEFSNRTFYDGNLDLTPVLGRATPESTCPIGVIYYEGDYVEKVHTKHRPSSVNRKQVLILEEEFGEQIRNWVDAGRSICLLTPFRAQETLLTEALERILSGAVIERGDVGAGADATDGDGAVGMVSVHTDTDRPRISTVHRSQGQEFDVVFLLPVDEARWEFPWSQERRLVNVAVTRAKEELYVIASAKMFSEDLRRSMGITVNGEVGYHNQWVYVTRLMDYVYEKHGASTTSGRFGIRRTRLLSIFDQPIKPTTGDTDPSIRPSRPERLLGAALKYMVGNADRPSRQHLEVRTHVSLRDLCVDGVPILECDLPEDLSTEMTFFENEASHLDVVICDGTTGELVLAIEVDGVFHRFDADVDKLHRQQANDETKNRLMAWIGGQHLEGNLFQERDPKCSFLFMRLPNDGTTYAETDLLQKNGGSIKAMRATGRVTLDYLIGTWVRAKAETEQASRTVTIADKS